MVDQKSENFRTLAGNHGGLRRGTAAAALGAVLVLSAGVPASNAAAPVLLTDAGEVVPSSPETDAVPGTAIEADPTVSRVKAVVDGSLSLEDWAGRILDDGEDDDESSASPAPTAPSFSPSSTPVPTVPVPTLPATPLPTTSPAPAPAPSPSSTAGSGPTQTSPAQTSPVQTSPSQTSAPAPAASRPGYPPAASVPAPATAQPTQPGAAAQPGASQLAPAGQPAPAGQTAQAPAGAPAAGSAAEAPERSAKGKLDTATSRPGAAGITSGVWGAGRLSSPMNMGTVDSRYSISRPSSAVVGSAQAGPVSPLVWAGAGLVILAGAAGLVAYKLRRAL